MDGLSDPLQVSCVAFLMSTLRITQFLCVLAAFGTGWTFKFDLLWATAAFGPFYMRVCVIWRRDTCLLWISFSCFWTFPFNGQLGFIPLSQDTIFLVKFNIDYFRMNPLAAISVIQLLLFTLCFFVILLYTCLVLTCWPVILNLLSLAYVVYKLGQVITCAAELYKLLLVQHYSSLMFGNMFLLLTLQITVGFNISILLK